MQILYVGAKGFFMSERRDSLCRSEGILYVGAKGFFMSERRDVSVAVKVHASN